MFYNSVLYNYKIICKIKQRITVGTWENKKLKGFYKNVIETKIKMKN